MKVTDVMGLFLARRENYNVVIFGIFMAICGMS